MYGPNRDIEETDTELLAWHRVRELVAQGPPGTSESWEKLLHGLMLRQIEQEREIAALQQEVFQSEIARRVAEEMQARQESRYRAMINSFEGYIYICSADYRIVFMNERLKERTGRDATGELCYEALHELASECPWCVNDQVFKGETVRWDVKSPKDDTWYHVSNTRICQPDGTMLKQALITDITKRKLYEEGLLETSETLRMLMDMMPVGVGWSDYEGRVEYLNQRFVEQFGYTLEDIPTVEEYFKLAYPEPALQASRRSFWYSAIEQARRTGTSIPPMETKIVCKDGSVRQVIRHIQLARNRVLNVYIDITEREAIREELLKIQKLESLGVLAGGIAHDFNNILTSVLGNISLARLMLDNPQKADTLLNNAEQASHRAGELSRQLLTFAKGGKPVKKIVSVQRILKESATLMMRGATVKAELHLPDSLHAVNADEGQLNQVFNNIVLNAVQAMPGGGTLTVEAENVDLDEANSMALPAGGYLRLSFTDDGCGIPEENLRKIFDPYFSTKSSGNGLGLASTQSIISRHGGHLGVTSIVGRGTTFVIHLPSTGATYSELEAGNGDAVAARPRGGTILIMDDDGSISELTSGMLEFLGYGVTACTTGERAVQLYKAARDAERPFAAVIVDLTVPGAMGGKEAARQILQFDRAARLIVSSGYSNDPVVADYRTHGFHAALPKPYKVGELERVLASL